MSKFSKFFRFSFLAIQLLLSIKATAACPAEEMAIGWDPYPPFAFEKNGKVEGMDIDLISKVLTSMNCKFRFEKKPFVRTLLEIEQGKLAGTISVVKTPEREAYGLFSASYIVDRNVLIVRKDGNIPNDVTLSNLIEKIPSVRIGITRSYEYGKTWVEAIKNPKFKSVLVTSETDDQSLQKLLYGKVDGVVIDEYVAQDIAKKLGKWSELKFHPMQISSGEGYFLFSKKLVNEDFITEFNSHLHAYLKSHDYKKMLKKYLP